MPPPSWIEDYRRPPVRARMLEFLGGPGLAQSTSVFLTMGNHVAPHHLEPRPVSDFNLCFEHGLDLSRSLWDRHSLLTHLDVDYVNFDQPAYSYLHPERVFELLEPVDASIRNILAAHGIHPIHLLSGRGHHYSWSIRQEGPAFEALRDLGRDRLLPSLQEFYERPHPPVCEAVPPALGQAYVGLGLLMEFLAHSVKLACTAQCQLPLQLTCLSVGSGAVGREMIALDISEYGDPLNVRVIRVPFSVYLKPGQERVALGPGAWSETAPIFCIPWPDQDYREGLKLMRQSARIAELAESTSMRLPDQTDGMTLLITDYKSSPLRRFHDWYYSQESHPPQDWPQTYDRTSREILPSCVQFILDHPNNLLLNLSCLQRVVRVFMSLGWHPRHVAGLIRSIYQRDHGWGHQWLHQEPAWRSEFYARMFSGLIAQGTDALVDFNCRSAQEEQLCFRSNCPDNLTIFAKSLKERIHHERLACRPVHGLFLPKTDS